MEHKTLTHRWISVKQEVPRNGVVVAVLLCDRESAFNGEPAAATYWDGRWVLAGTSFTTGVSHWCDCFPANL